MVINRILASACDLDRERLKRFKSGAFKMPPDRQNIDLDAKIAEKDAEIQKLGGSMANDYELAVIGGCLDDYPVYHMLSDAAHTSPADLRCFLKFDQNRSFVGFAYGPHDKDLITYAGYAMGLQVKNLINADKVVKFGLPASFVAIQNRTVKVRSDMPGMFNRPLA
jgi:hypothetical protein